MTTQTDLSAEEPSERAATGPQTKPVAAEATEPDAEATGPAEPPPEPTEAAESLPKATEATAPIVEATKATEPAAGTRGVSYTDLSTQRPTTRASTGPVLRAVFKCKAPGGTDIEAGATVEVPSGSPIETALASFIEYVGLVCVLVVLVVILAVAGVDTWLIAVPTGGVLVIATVIAFTRKRSSSS